MEDISILPNLQALNTEHTSKIQCLLEHCVKFLNNDVGVTVDVRRDNSFSNSNLS